MHHAKIPVDHRKGGVAEGGDGVGWPQLSTQGGIDALELCFFLMEHALSSLSNILYGALSSAIIKK